MPQSEDQHLQQIVEDCLPFVKKLFAALNICQEDDFEIDQYGYPAQIDGPTFSLFPVLEMKDGKEILKWSLTLIYDIPGYFNPRDGGYPPDVREKEMGVFENLYEVAKAVLYEEIEQQFEEVAWALQTDPSLEGCRIDISNRRKIE